MNSREKDVRTKKEGDPNYSKFPKISSRQWSCHKNPRIVRVSRAFGGKDRHSKVCTVRGLRDRRIRLSVPTAIQLYDLQDRLGLSQPSKVVDWLLDATKHEIDKLPPLPALPGNFTQFHQPTQVASHQSAANPQSSLSHFLASNHQINSKNSGFHPTKDGIASQQEQGNQDQGFGGFVAQLSKQNLFPLNNQSSFPNLPYNFHWDHPSLSLSHIGGGYNLSNETEDQSHNNLSTILNPSSQLYFTPCATTIPSIIPSFPSYITPSMDNDWRQMNNLQLVQQNPLLPTTLHLISSPMKSFTPNVNSKSINSQPNGNKRRGKDDRS